MLDAAARRLDRMDGFTFMLASQGAGLMLGLAITCWRMAMYAPLENKMLDSAEKWEKAGSLDAVNSGRGTATLTERERKILAEKVGPDGLTMREREILCDGVTIVDGRVVPPAPREN